MRIPGIKKRPRNTRSIWGNNKNIPKLQINSKAQKIRKHQEGK
jgi:hypothetical protein